MDFGLERKQRLERTGDFTMSYAVKDGDNWYQVNPPDAREGDQIKYYGGDWEPQNCFNTCCATYQNRRRLINPNLNAKPGEVWRIVGLEENTPIKCEVTSDGVDWNKCGPEWQGIRVQRIVTMNQSVLAIRVRVEKEWPRYWPPPNKSEGPYRKRSPQHSVEWFDLNDRRWRVTSTTEVFLNSISTRIPATEAERIMRGEEKTCATQTGNCVHCDKPIKDCECFSEQNPVPVESNAGQEICKHAVTYYSKEHDNFYCSQCKIGMGDEYYEQHIHQEHSKPTPKESDAKGPQVYLTYRCLPNPRTPFWYLIEKETEWLLSTTILETEHEVRKYIASIGAVKWMRCGPPYAIPPTPTASDDGFEKVETVHQWIRDHQKRYGRHLTDAECELVQAAWHAAKSKEGV
jgi:hypothetical protein